MADVTKSIGTSSRDYSTIQAFFDDIPADISAATGTGERWIGECYNDSEFTAVAVEGGTTTDATNYIWLKPASGEGFQDHVDVATNPLRYDQSKGVGIAVIAHYTTVLTMASNYCRISGMQVQNISWSNNAPSLASGSPSIFTAEDCILESPNAAGTNHLVFMYGTITMTNCYIYAGGISSSALRCYYGAAGSVFSGITIVRDSTRAAAGIAIINSGSNSSVIMRNVITCGFTSLFSTTVDFQTCLTDQGSPPTDWSTVTYADTFETTTGVSRDFRLKSGSGAIDAGTTDATYTPNDIFGAARPSGSSYDVGAHEFVSAGGASWSNVINSIITYTQINGIATSGITKVNNI